MLHTKKKLQTVVTGFTCDRCGTEVQVTDYLAHQEAHHIQFVGGYASVFGDGTKVECDLCQACLHTLIKDFCRATPAA